MTVKEFRKRLKRVKHPFAYARVSRREYDEMEDDVYGHSRIITLEPAPGFPLRSNGMRIDGVIVCWDREHADNRISWRRACFMQEHDRMGQRIRD